VRLLRPDTFLLPDKNGRLQTVQRFPFEEFKEAVNLRNEIYGPAKPPRYNLQQLVVTGSAGGEHARLRIEITVLVHAGGWVRVPLGLSRIVLREPAKYEGDGEQFLHFDQAGDGYVSWLRGEPGETHKLVLEALAPLVKLGGETALRLGAPRATMSSFSLDVSMPKAVGRLVDGARPLETEHQQNITRFSGLGLGGEFELTWRSGERPTARVPTALEANGAILARIDGRSVRSEARLTVRSFGGEFDQFRVRLPPGAELVAGNQPGYTLAPVEASMSGGEARLVDVKLDRKTVGPVEVRLVTEQSRALADADRSVELAGFEVVDAIRQWGHLAVEVIGDWQVLWGEKRNMRQVEDLPESLRGNEVVAGFEYFSQPCSLPARVIPRTTRVRVEPEFLLLVGARQASLEARLRYSVRGAKVYAFTIRLPGWEVETVSPSNVVDADAIVIGERGVVAVPLLQPTTGEVELVLKARRDLAASPAEIALPLPVPEATSRTPATVIVLADDNVELTPLPKKMAGLSPLQLAPRVRLPARQQPALYYRSEADPAEFVAAMEVHPQSIASGVSSVVQLEPQGGRVTQTLSYRVRYEPIDKLTLEVPRALAEADALQVALEGQTLAPVAAPRADRGDGPTPDTVPMRLSLPRARIGEFELVVGYAIPTPKIEPRRSVALPVPLVMPVEGKLEKNEVHVRSAPGLRVSHRQGAWTETELEGADGPRRELDLRADGRTSELPLAAQLEERLSPGSTVIHRVWLQTWLTTAARQDRVCYRFTSNEEQLKVTLPAGVAPHGVECLLDETLVPVELQGGDTLTIPLPPKAAGARRQLELRYNFVARAGSPGRLTLAAPRLDGGILNEKFCWQLILPRHEHLIAAPEHMIPEFHWGWRDFYWGRQPLRDQSQLETWVGATAGAAPPPTTNQYLFSALQIPAQLSVFTADRTLIVLLCSALALLVGLMLLYVPVSRHPGVLLTGTVALVAVGLQYPEPVLLAAQAEVLGLALVLVAALLKRLAARRRPGAPAPAHSTAGGTGRSASAGGHATTPPSAPPSSATTTIALHATEPNG
jgi:hypothetical protein